LGDWIIRLTHTRFHGLPVVEAVETLIELGANVNATHRTTGATPLHMLLVRMTPTPQQQIILRMEPIIRIAQMLIRAGANPDQPDHKGLVPRDWLLQKRSNKKMIENDDPSPQRIQQTNDEREENAAIDTLYNVLRNPHPCSELWQAIRDRNVSRVRSILSTRQQPLNSAHTIIPNLSSQTFSSLLEYVVEEIIRFDETISIMNQQSEDDETTKWEDATSWIEILKILLQHRGYSNHGKDDTMLETFQLKLLDTSTLHNSSSLGDDGDEPPQSSYAALLYKLIDRIRNVYKTTPKHPSATSSTSTSLRMTVQAIQMFHSAGIKLSPQLHDDSNYVLHDSVRRNELSFVQFLFGNNLVPDVNVRNRQGMTLLQFAARSGHVEMLVRTETNKKKHIFMF
jgi:ankyrin repeat protein